MKIAVDKNQLQKGSHEKSNAYNHLILERMGHELIGVKMPYGDYAEYTESVHEVIERRGNKYTKMDLAPRVRIAVDRKNSIGEICGNVSSKSAEHGRFRDECIRAQDNGCRFYVLIEDEKVKNLDDLEKWENPREKKYFVMKARQAKGYKIKYPIAKQPPASGKKLAKALRTMETKYGVEFVFCKPEDAAQRIVELLTKGE